MQRLQERPYVTQAAPLPVPTHLETILVLARQVTPQIAQI